MLKINNLNKYYFKKKSNEIHVLNDINLSFKDKGLYFLLGPSGSGKSTLLNVIGLLDSFDSGSIEIEDKIINKYKNVDDIRNEYFGYVFQNYLLNEELTVYENLDIVLKLVNYKEDHYTRIKEVLKTLGMEKYIKRKAKDLSGGQKQRIGIARCLIKTPSIILMDEPTGNLDEKNSIQVMDIVQKLSEKCLVIVVSHSEVLASSYADTIIRLKDGKIINIEDNYDKKELNANDLNTIYLKDYKNENLKNINVYYNDKLPSLDIVIQNNKIYIKGEGNIEIINDHSSLKLVNEHKENIVKEKIDLNISKLDNKESKHVLSFFELFKKAFKNKYKKLTKIAFIITSIVFASSIPFLSNLDKINPLDAVTTNTYIYEENSVVSNEELIPLLENDDILINRDFQSNLANVKAIDSKYFNNPTLYACYVPKNDNLNLVLGQKSDNPLDIYIDEIIATRLLKRNEFKAIGFKKINDFINKEIEFNLIPFKGKISGIVKSNEPSIYVDKKLLMINSYKKTLSLGYDFAYTNPSITSLNDDEYLVNEKYYQNGNVIIATDKNVVGTFKSDYDIEFLANSSTYLKNYYNNLNNYRLYTKNIKKFEDNLNVKFTNYREEEIEEYYTFKKATIITSTVFLITTISVSLVFLYFIMKSSLIHRIKEIGINRSIGVKKFDIYKIFSTEILSIVIRYSFPGFLLTVLMQIYLVNGGLFLNYNYWFIPLEMIIYLILSLLIGLIPIMQLLIKTPSEINKKYDI